MDGLTVKYVGPGELDQQAATIFADKPVPQDVPLYYFEVTILNKGDSGYIGVGFCADTVNPGRLPGWEPHSYGYHGDDGHAFHGSGQGRPYGPSYTTGDVIGALLDRSRKTISFYKNGAAVGVAFYDVQEQQLYPCVGMRTKHEEVRANFGGAAFAVDIKKLHAEFRERVLADIAAMQLPATVDVTPPAADSSPAALAAGPSSNTELEAAAAACRQAIRALDSSSSTTLASLETATQAYLTALEAAAGNASMSSGSLVAAAAAAAPTAALPTASSKAAPASQPLMLYYVFNYLLHRRCWKTAAIIAQEMLASTSSSDGRQSSSSPPAPPLDSTAAAAAADQPVAMECSSGGAADDHPMPDAPGEQPTSAAAAAAAAGSSSTSSAGAMPGAFSETDVQDALRRQRMYDAVCAGSIADALAVVRSQYGAAVLEANPHLHFKLRVQQFVELVREACSKASQQQSAAADARNGAAPGADAAAGAGIGFEAALAYGRAELGPGSKSQQDEELLSDALSLLAYSNPAASPCGHLLRESYRAELAEELNGALLKVRGSSGKPLLECTYRQAFALVEELKRTGVPAALVLDVASLCRMNAG